MLGETIRSRSILLASRQLNDVSGKAFIDQPLDTLLIIGGV